MKERILKYIHDFGSITTYEAFTQLGCTRLSEYIRQIRKDYAVEDEWVQAFNRYGEPTQYKKFWIEEVQDG